MKCVCIDQKTFDTYTSGLDIVVAYTDLEARSFAVVWYEEMPKLSADVYKCAEREILRWSVIDIIQGRIGSGKIPILLKLLHGRVHWHFLFISFRQHAREDRRKGIKSKYKIPIA